MTIKHSITEVNGLQVSFLQNSVEYPANTVIFVHGFPFNKEMWIAQLEHLPLGVQGIAYDVRGFGESSPGHGFFSIDLFASDLINLIKKFSLKQVVVCGLSMGGYIALRAYEKAPPLFSGIILADTNALSDNNEAKLNRFSTIEMIQQGEIEAFVEGFLHKVLHKKTLINNPEKVLLIGKMIMILPVDTLCATQLALASRTDTSHVLSLIKVPVLILRGEEDQLMTRELALSLHDRISNSKLFEIPASGHLPNIENPNLFNEAVNAFLRTQ